MTRDDVFQVIVDSARRVLAGLEEHRFTPVETLAELGASSVDRAEILIMTLESLELKIPLVKTAGPRNIGELADLLYEKLRSQ